MSDAYWTGYLAAQSGRPRECYNPWSLRWLREWYNGYDDYRRGK